MTGLADWHPATDMAAPGVQAAGTEAPDVDAPAVEPLAVIGVACRLPGAGDAEEFWRNLVDGVESVTTWTLAEQEQMGVPADELADPGFVPVSAVLDRPEYFDAAFFGMSAREAQLRDPQQRLFLELAHTALEDGGYDPACYPGEIGVYAGSGEDAYQWLNTRRSPGALAAAGPVGLAISSHPDYVATLASYKLNLRGPSLTLHTACSTSLVAVHVACEALRNGECDMALVGGVNLDLPLRRGYLYVEGGVHSPDGHCRAFDERAAGTIWGSGGAVILLKRLADAIADGDHIRALIIGNAINNDGAAKVGFTAPSEEGQAAVIAQALAAARVNPRTIGYVEAHGTGTALGDPIEVAALSSVYHRYSRDTGWCGIGSVKTNIGHLGPAAGIAGLVKTVLALERRLVPPSLNYERPNPKIRFDESPFYVNSALTTWEPDGTPRRAAVSSFGMGGTNAHVILEEAPRARIAAEAPAARRPRGEVSPVHLLQLSARTRAALDSAARSLADHLTRLSGPADDPAALADIAYTLRVGRRELKERLAVVAASLPEAAAALTDPRKAITGTAATQIPRVALLFPGQGAQYPGMGALLYRFEPVFRDAIDECSEILRTESGADLRELILDTGRGSGGSDSGAAEERLRQTAIAQPALFAVEYALARQWRSWGINPAGMIGHSIGEYVAAAVSGVFTLPDALHVVAERGRLMQSLPPGAMLAVQLDEAEVRAGLPESLAVAAVNGPGACVVSGPAAAIEEYAGRLAEADVATSMLRTSHAFHSPMMEPALSGLRAVVASVPRRPPQLPFLSNVTGEWITDSDATDPRYWERHMRETVRFGDGLATLLREGDWQLVECGPGRQLTGLVRLQQPGPRTTAMPSMRHRGHKQSDPEVLYSAAARLWVSGAKLNRESVGTPGYRVPLPTYPWQREFYWIKPEPGSGDAGPRAPRPRAASAVDDWFSVPVWRQLPASRLGTPPGRCLLLADDAAGALEEALRQTGSGVIRVRSGQAFCRDDAGTYRLRPASREDFDALLADLTSRDSLPSRIIHAWALDGEPAADADATWRAQDRGFFSAVSLLQALAGARREGEYHIDVVTAGTCDVTGADLTRPEHATLAGFTKVAPLELAWLTARHLDVDPAAGLTEGARAVAQVVAELYGESACDIALRAGRRWQREHEPVAVPADLDGLPRGAGLRDRGVYLITGGLGGIGITLAEDMAQRIGARLVLVSRSGLPPRDQWDTVAGAPGTSERTRRAIAAIRRMEGAGAEILVLAADVTSFQDMRRVREHMVRRFGRVDGIVHAAGLPGGGMAEVKERAAAEEVLAPKVRGVLSLRSAFGDLDLDFVALCSSVTALTGSFGQLDYCAANNFLDAHAHAPGGWNTPVISLNWGRWQEVGMAAEVAAPAAFRALQRGHLMTPVSHPVITAKYPGDGDSPGWCSGVISADTHWALDEHRIAGVPVLAGTGHLEAVRCAAEAVAAEPGRVIELRDVAFTQPLAVPDGTSAELRVIFTKGTDGLDFQVVSLAGENERTHARGSVGWVDRQPAGRADLDAIRSRCSEALREAGPASASASGLIAFGPHWHNLRRVYTGPREELAELEATQVTASDLDRWVLHPALLDEATSFGRTPEEHSYIPLGYGRVTVRGPLPAHMWSHLRVHDQAGTEVVVADLSLLDDTGEELVSVSDFTIRRIDPAALTTAISDGRDGGTGSAAASSPGGAAQKPDEARPADIRPPDGASAFRRLAGVDLGPQVVITADPRDLAPGAAAQIAEEIIDNDLGGAMRSQPGTRPAGDEYVAPRTELETVIARIWSDVLGIDRISVTDDFFELGGNSLVAIQIISLVRKQTNLQLPMRSLFEEPTVAGAAALAESLRGSQAGAG